MKTPLRALLASTALLASRIGALAATIAENTATARAFMAALDNGNSPAAMVAAGYIEHQQNSGFTLDAMAALVPEGADITIHRTIAEADKVFLHIEQTNPDMAFSRGDLFALMMQV